jgi:hypothetical protein
LIEFPIQVVEAVGFTSGGKTILTIVPNAIIDDGTILKV